MLDIRFHPECDLSELIAAAAGYQRLWDTHRQATVGQFRAVTGLVHTEGLINAIVWNGEPRTDRPVPVRCLVWFRQP